MNKEVTMRKTVPAVIAAVGVSLTLAACGAASTSASSDNTGDTSNAPLRIVLIPPTTGALAQYGADEVKGWTIAANEANANGGVDGHQVVLDIKSTDGQTSTTLQVARKAVTDDDDHFIGAVMTSTEAAALNPQLSSLGALAFNATAKDDSLIGSACADNSYHVVQTDGMDINGLASQLKTMPGTKWAIQAEDYATGHSAAAIFTKAAEAAGKQIVLTQYAPLNTTDFGSYITKIKNSGADAVFAVEYGADGVAFVKQAEQFNLSSQLKTVLGFNMVSEPLFPVLGNGVIGYYNNVGYDVNASNTQNKTFVADYTAKYGTAPYYVPADNYLAAEGLFAAVEKAHSVDPTAVNTALSGMQFDSIDGPITVRASDHQFLRPSYLGQVVKSGSGMAFKILSSAQPAQTTPTADPACKL
jgi:branched-chain amino acid transport system substrate-binding protein